MKRSSIFLFKLPNPYRLSFVFIFCILSFAFTAKVSISQNPEIQWQQCYGGSEHDKAYDIIQILNGFFIIGETNSSDYDVSYNHGMSDVWLIRTNIDGGLQWEKTYGGSLGDGGMNIVPAFYNNFYLISTSVSSDGDISNNPYPGLSNIWVVKVDSAGQIIWDKILGGSSIDETRNAIATHDGGVITIGLTGSNDGDISVYYGFWDIWIVKVNSNGEKEWDFTLGGTGMEEAGTIIQTSDGGYIVAASTDGEGGGNFNCEHHGTPGLYADAWLIKLDSLRNIEWQSCYGGTYHDFGDNVLEILNGYILLGATESIDGDVSGYHGIPGDPLGMDIWVVRLDTIGNILWQKCLGGSKGEYARNIFQTEDGGFMILGMTKSDNGDVIGFHGLAGNNYDIWIVKLSNMGELEWQKCLGGDGEEEIYHGVFKKNDYDYVIAGSSDYPSGDVVCNLHGWDDYWIFEINDSTSGFIETQKGQKEIWVYPNPADDHVVFEFKENIKKGSIQISNIFGQVVATLSIKNQKSKIKNQKLVWDMREVKPGVYFFRYEMNGVWGSGKIVISK